MTLGMNATMEDAKEILLEGSAIAQENKFLSKLWKGVVKGNTAVKLYSTEGPIYRAVAATEKGGRGKRIDRLIVDELRLHHDWKSYASAVPAMGARHLANPKGAQAVFITNQGDDRSVVLDALHKQATTEIEKGTATSLGLFEWSTPDGYDHTEPENWCYANPSLNLRLSWEVLEDAFELSKDGPEAEAYFKTEHLCMKVRALDPAIDSSKWAECFDKDFTLRGLRPDSFCLDISLNGNHATLAGTVILPDGRARVWVEKEWRDANSMALLDLELDDLLRKHKPRVFTSMPIGPAAAKAATFKTLRIPGVQIQEFTGEVTDACMSLAVEVRDLRISHPNDELLNAQITAVAKKHTAGRWKFTRDGKGNSDAAYAVAGAVHAARLLPPKRSKTLIGPDDGEE
jgi:hypothetical protein